MDLLAVEEVIETFGASLKFPRMFSLTLRQFFADF